MLNKNDLVENYAEKFGTTKAAAKEAINNTIEVMVDSLIDDTGFKLTGLFTLESVTRKGRDFKNPQNGKMMHKDDYRTLKVRLGTELKKALNGED